VPRGRLAHERALVALPGAIAAHAAASIAEDGDGQEASNYEQRASKSG
jgi:hypothetical protein